MPNAGDKKSQDSKEIPNPGDFQKIPKKSRWSENRKNLKFAKSFKISVENFKSFRSNFDIERSFQ